MSSALHLNAQPTPSVPRILKQSAISMAPNTGLTLDGAARPGSGCASLTPLPGSVMPIQSNLTAILQEGRPSAQPGAMIGAVTTITCKRCGLSFETEATTNTRCRRCRAVVRVPASARIPNGSGFRREHTIGVVLLGCGHPAVVVVHPGRSISATLKRYEWECPDTGAAVAATQVLAVLSEAEYDNLGQEAFDLLVSTGAAS
jgi:hypothetical protein